MKNTINLHLGAEQCINYNISHSEMFKKFVLSKI